MTVKTSRALIGILMLALVSSACRSPTPNVAAGPTPTSRPVTVSVATVRRGDIQSSLSYTGSVLAGKQVNVVPRITGRILKLNVDVGSVVRSGEVIAELDSSSILPQVAQAQAALDSAQTRLEQLKAGPRPETVAQARANLAAAQERLAAMKDGPRPETVAQAKANLDAARAKLAQLKAGPTQEQIKAAQLAVQQARNSLFAAQIQKDGSCNPRNPEYLCKAAQASANAAETAVEQAEQQLAILTSPPTKEALDQAQAAVDAAQQQYDLARAPYTAHDLAQAEAAVQAAQAQLALAEHPYTAQDLALAQKAVDQAQAGLDLARLQLSDARVTAPVDGVVAQKLLEVGAMASPATPIVSIVSQNVEVAINVEESKLGLIAPGQSATVQVPAYPGVSFRAVVIADPPTVDPKSRTALVRLAADDPKGQLKPGMYAQVAVLVQRQQNVLLVPSSALIDDNGTTKVYLVENGVVRTRPVSVGVEDAEHAQITSGVAEGQLVVVGSKPLLRDGDRVVPQATGG